MKAKLLLFLLAHILLGIITSQFRDFSYYYGIGVFCLGIVDIILNKNERNRAGFWAAYLVGLEVFLRMTGGVVFWEGGKYAVAVVLLVGLLAENAKKPVPRAVVVYFALLLPSLMVVSFPDFQEARERISFNLSGPFVLLLSAIYFYRRKLTGSELMTMLRGILFPLTIMLTYLILVTPDLDQINYGTGSNFTASGGFGPNQVSTAIGFGVFVLGLGLFYKSEIAGFLIIDALLLVTFLIRGLATFSRGGMMGGVIAMAILILYSAFFSKRPKILFYSISFVIIASLVGFNVWNYVNENTDGRLEYRYRSIDYRTGQEKDFSTGRSQILARELSMFANNPVLGVGPGMGVTLAEQHTGISVSSHSEYTRLLAEHGLFGVGALLILLFIPVKLIMDLPSQNRPIFLAIFFLALFTMFHSAMRLAAPGFFYGLIFILPKSE